MALVDNLAAYYSLDEASGDAIDAHSTHDGTDTNTVGSAAGIVSNARSFTAASSEKFSVADHADLDFSTAMTIQAWVYPVSPAANQTIASKWFYATQGAWTLSVVGADTNDIRMLIANALDDAAGQSGDTTTNCLPADTWTHVVVIYDGSLSGNSNRLKIYVNGSQETLSFTGTIPASLQNAATPLLLGDFGNLSRYWNGRLDEMGFWARALTGAEVTELYNAGAGRDYAYISGGGGGAVIPALDQGMLTGGLSTLGGGII